MSKRSIVKLLTSPSKVANALEWKKHSGSILSLTICKDKIDIAVSSHPCFGEPIMHLPSIPIKTETLDNIKVLKSSVVDELSSITKAFSVCGMVVSWPVQKEGWCGAPCGRVLHTLDQLTAQSKTTMLGSGKQPICLWDSEHHVLIEDKWGRTAIYSNVTENKSEHVASEEQYGDHDTVATNVWIDFCRAHWPELCYPQNVSSSSSRKQGSHVCSSNVSWLYKAKQDWDSLYQNLL